MLKLNNILYLLAILEIFWSENCLCRYEIFSLFWQKKIPSHTVFPEGRGKACLPVGRVRGCVFFIVVGDPRGHEYFLRIPPSRI
jgi:hypothetical protein